VGLTTPPHSNISVQKPKDERCRADHRNQPCKNKDMILAIWNVLSLFRPGALAKLKEELKN
jgi:hypothetical protein